MLKRILFGIALLAPVQVWCADSGSILVLKTAWAQKYRNRLSVEAKVTILHVSAKEKDADIHGGSRVNQVGLPMVAEILNGTQPSQKRVRQEMQPNQGSSQKTIYGAWRLWFEHPPKGGGAQCQNFGSGAPAMCDRQALRGSDSNPDHSFEIHPVFAVNGVAAARTSMVLLPDNQGVYDAKSAFKVYTAKTRKVNIARSKSGLTLNSTRIAYNYVRLRVRVTSASTKTLRDDGTSDGGWVSADVVTDDDDEVLQQGARIFYFADSAPGDALQKSHSGDELELLGIPRLSLDTILRVSEGKQTISIPLPLEFVAVALLPLT